MEDAYYQFRRLPKDPNGFTYERLGGEWWVFGPGFIKWIKLAEYIKNQLLFYKLRKRIDKL